jgi:signal transduction protein with GAF and PtsI domain
MAINEGLAGLVAEQVRPVAVEKAQGHPRFKYFREAGEDAYQSFLGVPLIDRGTAIPTGANWPLPLPELPH